MPARGRRWQLTASDFLDSFAAFDSLDSLMAEGQLLFGTVAVKLGFVSEEQARQCAAVQEKLLALGVKKPVGEIMLEQGWITREQLQAVIDYQKFRKERSADKKLGEVAVENGFCTEAQLQDALKTQKEFFNNNQKTYPLGKILIDRGIITDQQLKALIRLQQRIARPQSVDAPRIEVGVRECGNCFEAVSIHAKKCPKCGNAFHQLEIAVRCKVCQKDQHTPGEYCASCGANLVTGAMPNDANLRKCKKCGRFSAAYQPECFHCGYTWDATMKRERKKTGERIKRSAKDLVRWAVVAVIVLVFAWAAFNFATLRDWVLGAAVGEEAVAVKNRTESFLKALQFKDEPAAIGVLTSKKDFAPLFKELFGLEAEQYMLTSYSIADVKAEPQKATVYVEAALGAVKKEPGKNPSPQEQLEALVKGGGGGEKRRITLTWVKKGEDWRLER
jgi:hypothetical protein